MSASVKTTETNPLAAGDITAYQVISLLLDGALERVDEAISRLDKGDIDQAAILVQKTIGIVGGLRESLDLDQGGEIATNLDSLYEYIVAKLDAIAQESSPIATLEEVRKLLSEVYEGWQGIEREVV